MEHKYSITFKQYSFEIENILEIQGNAPRLLNFSSIKANRTNISSVNISQPLRGTNFSKSKHIYKLLLLWVKLSFKVLKNLRMGFFLKEALRLFRFPKRADKKLLIKDLQF